MNLAAEPPSQQILNNTFSIYKKPLLKCLKVDLRRIWHKMILYN